MHRKEGIPRSVSALLWRPALICARCLCFHSSQSDNYRPLCSELLSLVWLVPQAVQTGRGKHGGGIDSCRCLQSAGMPDGFLIDFLVLPQFFIPTSPARCQRCAAEDSSLGQNPAQMSTCYSCARGLIYEWKSSRVQFLTAEADNGGD